MALTNCKECGHQISKSAKTCPGCGAKIRRTGLLTKLVAVFIGLIVIGMFFGEPAQLSQQTQERARETAEQARLASLSPEERAVVEQRKAAEAPANREMELQRLGLKWSYKEEQDAMGRGTIRMAWVRSLNEVKFDFPYQGSQRGTLILRVHPKYGTDIILSVEKGQFLCGIDGCNIAARFNSGKPQAFKSVEPSDHSATSIFVKDQARFLAILRKSKKLYIEAPFYQEGTRVFQFDVSGLQ